MKKDKICNICNLAINDKNEYAEFLHYKKEGSILSQAYYHIQCFRERFIIPNIKTAMVLDKANKIMDRIAAV